MALDRFNPLLRTNDLVQDLKWDAQLRRRFAESQEQVLAEYPLTDEERTALRARDFLALHNLGVHPYLLSQLARLIHGTGEKTGSSDATTALLRSLLGDEYDGYMASRGV
ncbi:hypothetical protein SRB5_18750 [Streptomyces sp. RB5]|uniref:Extradiol ring-cleavage dioxygenase LigAB LigA subunit domain-containing protein n=1 Tax=Streptomyces smaragdinus TaxID=2585196 RepID=A0A7K0CEF7_9ACTN|nr:extradiol ring-cleavage dioxygenase [Streptomyces smaragdinus]MQY11756.1 hypothetical protein [Streptomyces smaragdinus]